MTFDEKLQTYAELIVSHGLNVQKGQLVNISTEVIHRDFAYLLAKVAYEKGAKYVSVDLVDPRVAKVRLENSTDQDLEYTPEYLPVRYKELVDETAANLKLIGSEDPDLLSDSDPKKINAVRMSTMKALKYFYAEGIGKSKVHWTVAAAATPSWAQKVFPDLEPEQAMTELWNSIFSICRADKPNCLELWKEHNDRLQFRAKKLTELKIEKLHFTGPGTDLNVKLSPKAIFKGGGDNSPRDVEFEPNLPTEEVFTTPDFRGTEGNVRATRPFVVNGKLIENLEMKFEGGRLVDFSATSGEETFREYISSDEGACRLGEVALVGIDSPVFQSGNVFYEILFDENAACHIAVGSAYKFCIEGGDTMNEEEFAAIGCNESCVHTDMMISSEEVNCVGTTYAGQEVQLIQNGSWTI